MLEKNIKSYVETSGFLNLDFAIDEFIGTMHCPTLNKLGSNFFFYNFYVNNFISMYEKDNDNFYNQLISSKQNMQDFLSLISYFKKYKKIFFKEGKFYIFYYDDDYDEEIENIKSEHLKINHIDFNNINIFMDTLAVLHWRDNNIKKYKPANKIAEEMLKRANELKAEIQKKVKKKDGIGILEIMSSVCARHPSINPTNIKKLNYYQIIDQFNRLQMVDEFGRYSNAWSSGVLDENGISEMAKKHYTNKIELNG